MSGCINMDREVPEVSPTREEEEALRKRIRALEEDVRKIEPLVGFDVEPLSRVDIGED